MVVDMEKQTITNLSEFVKANQGSVLLDHETVGAQVHEQARQSHQMLRDADSGTAPGENHKELVLVRQPDAGEKPFRAAEGTFYRFFKSYPIDNETWKESNAVNDGFYQSVFATDEAEDKLERIFETIAYEHASILVDGESWKPTGERDPDYFPAISFSRDGAKVLDPGNDTDAPKVIDTLIDMEAMLPAVCLPGAKWYMNRRTRAELRKIRNSNGDLILTSDNSGGSSILGYPVVISDSIPVMPEDNLEHPAVSIFIMFGDMKSAIKVSDVEGSSQFINNPYNEGYKTLKYETKFGIYALDTTSLVLGVAAPEPNAP